MVRGRDVVICSLIGAGLGAAVPVAMVALDDSPDRAARPVKPPFASAVDRWDDVENGLRAWVSMARRTDAVDPLRLDSVAVDRVWDRVIVHPSGSNLRGSGIGLAFPFGEHSVLEFCLGAEAVGFAAVAGFDGDFSRSARPGGYTRDEAVFRVEIAPRSEAAFAWPYVVAADAPR